MTAFNLCMYCRAPLTATTRLAHVWPASLGGRLRGRWFCCDTCNNAIGAFEDALRASLAHAFAAVGAVDDDRDPIAVKVAYDGLEFRLADGNAILDVPPVTFDREKKMMIVPLPAGLARQADACAKTMLSHGLGPDDVWKLDMIPSNFKPVLPVGPTYNEYDLKIGAAVAHKQTFVKMALELIAYYRYDLVMHGELSAARRFARHASGTFGGKPDARSRGSGLIPTTDLPEVYNAIEAWSFNTSCFFRIIALGPITFTGTLTTSWSGEPFRVAYAFDARNPTNVITSQLVADDGPNLDVFHEGVRQETIELTTTMLEEVSRRLAESKPRIEREEPPLIEALREAVKSRMLELIARAQKREKARS